MSCTTCNPVQAHEIVINTVLTTGKYYWLNIEELGLNLLEITTEGGTGDWVAGYVSGPYDSCVIGCAQITTTTTTVITTTTTSTTSTPTSTTTTTGPTTTTTTTLSCEQSTRYYALYNLVNGTDITSSYSTAYTALCDYMNNARSISETTLTRTAYSVPTIGDVVWQNQCDGSKKSAGYYIYGGLQDGSFEQTYLKVVQVNSSGKIEAIWENECCESVTKITLKFSITSSSDACSTSNTINTYIVGTTFANALAVTKNATKCYNDVDTWYSDGTIVRQWTSSGGGDLGSASLCPGITTTTTTTAAAGTTTTTTALVCYTIYLKYDSSVGSFACSSSDNPYNIDAYNFTSATKIYTYPGGATCSSFASNGYYSDGSVYRYWNGSSLGTAVSCSATSTTTTTAAPTCYTYTLYYSSVDGQTACDNNSPSTLYGNASTFSSSTLLYVTSNCNTSAPSGYYSNKTIWKYWNGSSFTSSGNCENPDQPQ